MTSNEKALGEALHSLTIAVIDLQHSQHTAMKVLEQLAGDSPPAALSELGPYLRKADQQLATVRSQLAVLGFRS